MPELRIQELLRWACFAEKSEMLREERAKRTAAHWSKSYWSQSAHCGLMQNRRSMVLVWCRHACGHVDMGTCPHQVLAATLTLFQPRVADYTHLSQHILLSPPSFESHRCACDRCMYYALPSHLHCETLRSVLILLHCFIKRSGWESSIKKYAWFHNTYFSA